MREYVSAAEPLSDGPDKCLPLAPPAACLLLLRVSQAGEKGVGEGGGLARIAAAGSVRVRRGFGVRASLRAPCAGGSRRQPPKRVAAVQRPLLPTPRRSYRPDEQGVVKRPPRHADILRVNERADPLRHWHSTARRGCCAAPGRRCRGHVHQISE